MPPMLSPAVVPPDMLPPPLGLLFGFWHPMKENPPRAGLAAAKRIALRMNCPSLEELGRKVPARAVATLAWRGSQQSGRRRQNPDPGGPPYSRRDWLRTNDLQN